MSAHNNQDILATINKFHNLQQGINTFKYHVFAPMGRFQLESIYLYLAGTTVENKGKLIL